MNTRLRSCLGPLVVGIGTWCAAGHVSLLGSGASDGRIGIAAPFWWVLIGTAIGALIPGCRRHPATATPALLATVPWWPVSLPAIALLWTGPLAWFAIGLAVFAGSARPIGAGWKGRTFPLGAGPFQSAALAGALTLAATLATAWSLAPRLPGGDEPHYLVITQSLISDGDLRIENNHARRDYASYFGGSLAPDYLTRGRDGEIYSVHAPGTSIVVLPGFFAFGYRGAQGTMLLIAAMTAALVWYIGWLATGDRPAAWFAWAAISGTVTFLFQGVTIFPDGPGALMAAVTLVTILEADGSRRIAPKWWLAASSAALALLPWLHTRFAVLAAGLGALILWRLLCDGSRPLPRRFLRAGLFLLLPMASAVAWFSYFQTIYGTPNPAAPYGSAEAGMRLAFAPGGLLALFFDQQFGLLTYSPVLVAGLFGLSRAAGSPSRPLRGALSVGLLYLAVVAMYWMWWAGTPATPARFATAMLPVLAAPAAVTWNRSGAAARWIWLLLLAVSLTTSVLVLGKDHGALAWNVRGVSAAWLAWLGPLVNLTEAWPSFFRGLTPAVVRTEGHFISHALLWAAVFAVTSGALWWARRLWPGTDRRAPLAASWWFVASLMVAVPLGWWCTGVTGVEPSSSQLAMLRTVADHPDRPLVQLGAASMARKAPTDIRIRFVRAEQEDDGPATWNALHAVPAGDYRLTISRHRAEAGLVTLRLAASATSLAALTSIALTSSSTLQSADISLPAGAMDLVVEPDADTAAQIRSIELRPVELAHDGLSPAVSRARFGADDVYFLDDHVFVEGDGFWVQGQQKTAVAVSARPDARLVTLELSNGPKPNRVTIGGAVNQSVTLGPGAMAAVPVGTTTSKLIRLTIASSAGFRPSDDGRSADGRDLGVRVRIR